MFNKVSILGVGLIGGSLARIIKNNNLAQRVCGYDISESELNKAVSLGVLDDYSLSLRDVIEDADLIVFSTPVMSILDLVNDMAGWIKPGAIITDVGSSKTHVVQCLKSSLSAEQFCNVVPAHPIAGKENTGVEVSSAELFRDHLVILTPLKETSEAAITAVSTIWTTAGARLTRMTTTHHDRVLAATSHLPHMLAYALVDCLSAMDEKEEIFSYAAGGFADISRTASSSPEMWRDICLANKDDILQVLTLFSDHLEIVTDAIRRGDGESLMTLFSAARESRNQYIEKRK
jgi:prephenate dehydrogenase